MIYQTCGLDKKSRILLIRLFWRRRREAFPLGKSCDEAFASELTTPFVALAHSIRGKATKESENQPPCSANKKRHRVVSFFVGGEGEIRTLEPCYGLHDFQSCALDQLGEFSKY